MSVDRLAGWPAEDTSTPESRPDPPPKNTDGNMIRRKTSATGYLLISQIQHARLAADIAKIWSSTELENYTLADDLHYAIEHHDDGWKDRDNTPDLNPATDLPRSFTEMEPDTALAIACRCIQACATHSPVCAYWVSQHFQILAEQRQQSADLTPHAKQQTDRFLQQQRATSGRHLPDIPAQILRQGTAWLRFFDRISLLLCCRLPADPDHTVAPDGQHVTIEQRPADDGTVAVKIPDGIRHAARLAVACH